MKVKEKLFEEREELVRARGQKKVELHERILGREYKRVRK